MLVPKERACSKLRYGINKLIQLSFFVTHHEGKKKCPRIGDQPGNNELARSGTKEPLLIPSFLYVTTPWSPWT